MKDEILFPPHGTIGHSPLPWLLMSSASSLSHKAYLQLQLFNCTSPQPPFVCFGGGGALKEHFVSSGCSCRCDPAPSREIQIGTFKLKIRVAGVRHLFFLFFFWGGWGGGNVPIKGVYGLSSRAMVMRRVLLQHLFVFLQTNPGLYQ